MNRYPPGQPCWAPGAARRLKALLWDLEDVCAWEWGGGASSIWLAPQISFLSVMEHDRAWADKVIDGTDPEKCEVFRRDMDDPNYIDLVELCKPQPTLWLIDGYKRIDCLELVLRKRKDDDIIVMDDALDYAGDLADLTRIEKFAMPHPHAGLPCVSDKNKRDRNTKRTHAPATKETWIWRV